MAQAEALRAAGLPGQLRGVIGRREALRLRTGLRLDALDDRVTGEEADMVFAFRGLFTWRY